MRDSPPPLKRLLAPFGLIIVVSSIFYSSLIGFFVDVSAADSDQEVANLTHENFQSMDPYVCLLPEDGVFLPCHANLIEDFMPFTRGAQSVITNTLCVDHEAAGYPCHHVDLMAYLSLDEFSSAGGSASDIWGWTDPVSGSEIVILTLQDRTSFIDISDPIRPKILAHLMIPAGAIPSFWRDVKTYENYAYVVGDMAQDFGLQIFDLNRLAHITQTAVLTADNHYTGISSTHNIAINQETGLAALVGVSTGIERCDGGMHLLDLAADPLNPPFVGCVSEDGYVHDAHCVVYHGADTAYLNQEICFNFNQSKLTIVDVTDRNSPIEISVTNYEGSAYTHQGWVGADHRYLLLDDESDERVNGVNTTTYIWNIDDLEKPVLIKPYTSTTQASDHNQYIHMGYTFQANYRAGLRILDAAHASEGELDEVAYFDIFPADDDSSYNGAWSVYPYFESGLVAISGIESGLYIVRPTNLHNHRMEVKPSPSISVSLGSTHTFTFSVRTIGLPDMYTLTLESNGWGAELQVDEVVNGSAKQILDIPVSVTIPATATQSNTISLLIESAHRQGYSQTVSKELDLLVEPVLSVLIEPQASVWAENGVVTQSVRVTNQSSQPEQFEVEAQPDLWNITPAVVRTPLLQVGESYLAAFVVEVGEGAQTTYTLTVVAAADGTTIGQQTAALTLSTAAETSVLSTTLPSPSPELDAVVTLTNTGDYTDSFSIIFDQAGLISGAQNSGFLEVGDSTDLAFRLDVLARGSLGRGSLGRGSIEAELIFVSDRSGAEVGRVRLNHRYFSAYLPFVDTGTHDAH